MRMYVGVGMRLFYFFACLLFATTYAKQFHLDLIFEFSCSLSHWWHLCDIVSIYVYCVCAYFCTFLCA